MWGESRGLPTLSKCGRPLRPPELLTVGVSSAQQPHGSRLRNTLRPLFQASSGPEPECIVVLASLSDSDPEWLSQTAANISDLFRAHTEAQQLLAVRGRPGGPPVPGGLHNASHSSPCEAPYSRQKADYEIGRASCRERVSSPV